jgi:hypothetical protein
MTIAATAIVTMSITYTTPPFLPLFSAMPVISLLTFACDAYRSYGHLANIPMHILWLEKLIDSKVKGKPITEKRVEKVQETQDLAAALKASLQQKTKVKTKR